MGNTDKYLDKLGASAELRETVAKAEAVIGVVAAAWSGVGTAVAIYKGATWALTALGFLDEEPDPIKQLSDKVDHLTEFVKTKFAEVLDAVHQEALVLRWMTIGEYLSKARSAFDLLKPHVHDSPEFKERKDDADTLSIQALNTLGLPSFWTRPFYQAWVYNDPWSGPLTPPAQQGEKGLFVFDYRLVLPAYLEVLAWRISVIGLIGMDSKKHSPPFSELAAKLLDIHDRIFQGIVTLRTPSEKEIAPYYHKQPLVNMTDEYQKRNSVWSERGRKYGAVETYSAVAAVETYPALFFAPLPEAPKPIKTVESPGELQSPEQMRIRQAIQKQYAQKLEKFQKAMAVYEAGVKETHRRFLPRHALRTLRKRKLAYAAVGLPSVWRTVNHLRKLSGKDALGICHFGAWSLREADELLRQTTGAAPSATVSLRDTVSRLPDFAPSNTISLLGLAEG